MACYHTSQCPRAPRKSASVWNGSKRRQDITSSTQIRTGNRGFRSSAAASAAEGEGNNGNNDDETYRDDETEDDDDDDDDDDEDNAEEDVNGTEAQETDPLADREMPIRSTIAHQ